MIFREFLAPTTGCASDLFGGGGKACCAVVVEMSWGRYPSFFAAHGLGVERIGVSKAADPLVWGVLQSSPARCPASDARA